jgi:hypothetical protein
MDQNHNQKKGNAARPINLLPAYSAPKSVITFPDYVFTTIVSKKKNVFSHVQIKKKSIRPLLFLIGQKYRST